MKVFEKQLYQIESNFARHQIHLILEDMMNDQYISGAQYLQICKNQLIHETSTEIIRTVSNTMKRVFKQYIPVEYFEKITGEMFELLLDEVLVKGKITDKATRQTLLETIIYCCQNENHCSMVVKWLEDGFAQNTKGKKIDDMPLTTT